MKRFEIPAKVASWRGLGLFVGTLKDGRPFIYQGGVVRVRRQDLSGTADDLVVWEAAMEELSRQIAARGSRSDCEPADDMPLELTGCQDPESGDWLLLWRLACVEVTTH